MGKTKTSKKPKAFSINDLAQVKLKSDVKTKPHNPSKNLSDINFIRNALMDAMFSGDERAFKEILKSHFEAVNIRSSTKKAELSERTFYQALSEHGNPSLKTIIKLTKAIKDKKAS